jgi:uncharacterized protein YqfB (UPF0267 family)
MKTISFHDKLIISVLNKKKTETLRYQENENINSGDEVIVIRQSGEKVGLIKILSKTHLAYGALSEEDAKTHDKKNLEDLKHSILTFYPNLKNDSILIKFQFLLLKIF